MKIAVSSLGEDMDSMVDERFGRCKAFLIVDSETMDFEVLQNAGISATGGAGIQAASSLADKGVNAVITGSVGPNAFSTLSAAGIKQFVGAGGKTIRDAVEMQKRGELNEPAGSTSASHSGMGR